jgi:predicted SprT family Zn-dependent metalloprotease
MKRLSSVLKSAFPKSISESLDNSSTPSEENTKEKCEHKNPFYQPREFDTNIAESYYCDDCGKELSLPEPDEDTMRGEER